MRIFLLSCFLVSCFGAIAQMPTTNIFLLDFSQIDDNNYNVANPIFVTSDNSNSYNNQPHFIGNHLYLSSVRAGSEKTDVFAYDFDKKMVTQVTATNMSEYSPTLMPDGAHFSSVCIEADGSTQRLWKYPVDRRGAPSLVMDQVYNVGYHAWIGDSKVGLFIVGEPHTLQIVDLETRESKTVASNIGRSLQVLGNNLYFVQKSEKSSWSIKKYDTLNLDMTSVAITLPEQEDFIILPDGTLLMGLGTKLYKYKPKKDMDWVEVVDLKPIGVKKISRLALSSGKLAVVTE